MYKVLSMVLDNRLKNITRKIVVKSLIVTFYEGQTELGRVLIANDIVDKARKNKR